MGAVLMTPTVLGTVFLQIQYIHSLNVVYSTFVDKFWCTSTYYYSLYDNSVSAGELCFNTRAIISKSLETVIKLF